MRVKCLIISAAAALGISATASAVPSNAPAATDNTEPSYLLWLHLAQYDDCSADLAVRETVRAEVDRVPELDGTEAVQALNWVLESSPCAAMQDYVTNALMLAQSDMESFEIEIGLIDAPDVPFEKRRPEGQRASNGSSITPLGLPPTRSGPPQGSDYEN